MIQEQAIVFDCAGDRLVGILHPGAADADTGVVIVVGGPQYRVGSHRQFVLMARHFASAGIPVLRFDYRGMGDSEGAPRAFDTVDDDIRSAVDCLMDELPHIKKIVLLGLCDAASANLIYAHTDERVYGLILLNPWVRTAQGEAKAYLRHYYLQRLLQRSFWRKVFAGDLQMGRSIKEFLQMRRAARNTQTDRTDDGLATQLAFIDRMLGGLLEFDGPLLCVISGRDLTAQEFTGLCDANKSWRDLMSRDGAEHRRFPEADHTMSSGSQLRALSRCCVSWLSSI